MNYEVNEFIMGYSKNTTLYNQKGISILEILLALVIVAVIAFYSTRMIHLVDAGNKADQCFDRMTDIAVRIKDFYRSQETLPEPVENSAIAAITETAGEVPVNRLNLSQKYRLDTWGKYFLYYRPIKQDEFFGKDITDIAGCQVDGRFAAGVLISLGPDQKPDYIFDDTTNPLKFTTAGDDLLLPINVDIEAMDIVVADLEVLDKRVSAYDRHFAGIDNRNVEARRDRHNYIHTDEVPPDPYPPYPDPTENPDLPDNRRFLDLYYLLDADGCIRAVGGTRARSGVGCLPEPPVNDLENDPNCGRATINDCESSDGVLTVLNDILAIYGLSERNLTDPWGNFYQWGNSTTFGPDDRRYHLFYSMGPDGEVGTDDDISTY